MRKPTELTGGVPVCTLAALTLAAFAPPMQAAPPGELPFGVYDPYGTFTDDADVQIEHLFLPWEDLFIDSLPTADEYARDRGREVLVTIEPWTWTRSARNSPGVLTRGISAGEYDGNMAAICNVLGGFESDVTVRWAQEMEDFSGQFIWAKWEPETYVAAYQRMMDICKTQAPDIKMMWSPLGYEDLEEYYPGDEYVDVVGLSVFGLQPWEKQILGGEQSAADILGPRMERVRQFNKPVMVAELGFSGDADYVEAWENSIRFLGEQFPELTAVVYFNQTEVYPWPDGFGLPDWRVDYRTIIQSAENRP